MEKVTEKCEKKVTAERLEKLGLSGASNELKAMAEYKRKTMIAYEHFRFVSQEKIDEFNAKLRNKTAKDYRFDKLCCIDLKVYSEVPPAKVLEDLEQAIGKKCFDSYEVAKIESVEERPDPILFGRISQCKDRFFISQWDDDVKIEDILEENEG